MFPINRLLEEIDRLIENDVIQEEVFAQVGCCTYRPRQYNYTPFLNRTSMEDYIQKADLIICHAGSSSIIGGLKRGKKIIVVPRRAEMKEHVDNHQFELANIMEENGCVLKVNDISELASKLTEIKSFVPNAYVSNTDGILAIIKETIAI